MKTKIVRCIMVCAFMLALGGLDLSLQTLDFGTTTAAYAWGHKGDRGGHQGGNNSGGGTDLPAPRPDEPVPVPEPSLLALAAAGIGGYGVYRLIRKNKK